MKYIEKAARPAGSARPRHKRSAGELASWRRVKRSAKATELRAAILAAIAEEVRL